VPDRIRAVIVDDEAPARSLLREYLGAHDDAEIVSECMNGFEAVKRIGELSPDLIFLDVQMPKLDGFEVLELLDKPPAVVYVTAYDEYALKAFDVHAVDYVLKPIGRERLAEALAHVRRRLEEAAAPADSNLVDTQPRPSATALAAAARPPGQYLERVLIKDGVNVHVIPVERVDWIEAQDDYVGIHAEGRTHLKSQALGDLETSMDPGRFVRVHRSYLLNVDRLARLELYAKDSRVAILKDGSQMPVSRAGYLKLKEMLDA